VRLEPENYPLRFKLGEAYTKKKMMNLAVEQYKYIVEHSKGKEADAALIALGAKVRVFVPQGTREVGLDKFFLTPASDDQREYDLKPNEILTDILVPPTKGTKMAIYEVRQREALDYPLAAAAVVLRLDGKTVKSARVVLGHVAPVPWPAPEAEAVLVGKTISEAVADEAGKAAVSKATPLSKNAYKVQLARVAVKRAILRAAQGGA
jgi:xanthine dehydrogenase YagS FAD-binding subunit